ncbi:MAG: MFS transporter [Candidatus Hydrogenedentes bacterium]|nr:MFS transporter [Candidatus Hydrogenedentota bacterium]
MPRHKLPFKAWIVLILNVLYNVADSLCSVFVGVYLYLNSLDFSVVCYHYVVLYAVCPVAYVFAGWYSQVYDRVHVFRAGMVMHAVYYATLLWLQEDAAKYVVELGALLGVAWGLFYAGANTFNYDVVEPHERNYFFGIQQAFVSTSKFIAPLLSGVLIGLFPVKLEGYIFIFAVATVIYAIGIAVSFAVPHDRIRRPFKFWRAMFPGRDQRDWRLLMIVSATFAGSFEIFGFLLGLIIYMKTSQESLVGSLTAAQALMTIAVSYAIGRWMIASQRGPAMYYATFLFVAAGLVLFYEISIFTLFLFAVLQSIALPLFGIPFSSVRFEAIDRSVEEPAQRIEYMCASEFPLGLGRVLMVLVLIALWNGMGEAGFRWAILILCLNRIGSYLIVRQLSGVWPERS